MSAIKGVIIHAAETCQNPACELRELAIGHIMGGPNDGRMGIGIRTNGGVDLNVSIPVEVLLWVVQNAGNIVLDEMNRGRLTDNRPPDFGPSGG